MVRYSQQLGRVGRLAMPFCLLLLLIQPGADGQDIPRDLTGTVTDRSKEPLKGAVVQVQSEVSNTVVSYITDASGSFSFKRLRGDTDYKVWATYRERRSKNRELSHFDGKTHPVMKLTIWLQ